MTISIVTMRPTLARKDRISRGAEAKVNRFSPLLINVLAVGFLLCGVSAAYAEDTDEEVAATPYRPTISNPAALSAPGWLEVEFGMLDVKSADTTRTKTVPYVLKYAFSKDFGVLLGGDSHLLQVDPDRKRTSGYGDTTVLFKHRWGLTDPDDALGLEWGAKVPTAQNGLGSGNTDTVLNGIYSTEVVGTTIDFNLGLTRIGAIQQGESRNQWSSAIALSRALNEKWIVAFEVAGTRRSGVPFSSQYLATVAYVVSNRMVVDVGLAKGLQANDHMVFAGITMLLEKIR
ncbi:MAG TPA: hypothetical protein VFW68_12555 [Rhodocyclaceae bacterium]|nr:hypothetical protein [Rhodocyclaceae bacterium]